MRRRDTSGGSTYVPVEVVPEASQTLCRAHVLVQASLAVAARHPLSSSAQHRRRLAAADLPRRRVHVQLQRERQDQSASETGGRGRSQIGGQQKTNPRRLCSEFYFLTADPRHTGEPEKV